MERYAFFLIISLLCTVSSLLGSYSQWGQDTYLNEHYFKNMQQGTFVEIGAHDGITYSNTYFFEKEFNWDGICVEPLPEIVQKLRKNRSSTVVEGCVTDFTGTGHFLKITSPEVNTEMLSGLLEKYDPRHLERIQRELERYGGSYEIIKVPCYQLCDLLNENGMDHINLLSIDTEGGELDILKSIDYSKYQIDMILVEDNYFDIRIKRFLASKGYQLIKRHYHDLIFIHESYKR